MPAINVLYLAVLPQIHVSLNQVMGFGLTEQVLTLFPDIKFATLFFPDEVDTFINTFREREKYLVGGHVVGFEIFKQPTLDGRVIVRVHQHVA
jgi:hypothetical protein